jgi:hypothetical protein
MVLIMLGISWCGLLRPPGQGRVTHRVSSNRLSLPRLIWDSAAQCNGM